MTGGTISPWSGGRRRGRRKTTHLSGSCPSNDTNDLARTDLDAEIAEDGREFGTVLHDDVVESDTALRRPFLRRAVPLDDSGSFLREVVGVVEDALDRVEVVLDLGALTNHPGERRRNRQDVGENEAGLRRVDRGPASAKKVSRIAGS